MESITSSRIRSARLASVETTSYIADESSIGAVTARGVRPTSSVSSRLAASTVGATIGPLSAPRFSAIPSSPSNGSAGSDRAHSSGPRSGSNSSKQRLYAASSVTGKSQTPLRPEPQGGKREKPSLADRLQERIAKANRGLLVVGAIVLTLVVCVIALYGPLRDYYVARRSNEYLAVQLEALEEANKDVQQDLDALQTREGIEDEARRRGYIEEGTTAVNVVGLPPGSDEQSGGDSVFTEVKEVETHWYTDILDRLFGYTPPQL